MSDNPFWCLSDVWGNFVYVHDGKRKHLKKTSFGEFRWKSIGRTSVQDPLSVWIGKPANLLLLWVMTTYAVSQSKMVHGCLLPIFDYSAWSPPPLAILPPPRPVYTVYWTVGGRTWVCKHLSLATSRRYSLRPMPSLCSYLSSVARWQKFRPKAQKGPQKKKIGTLV